MIMRLISYARKGNLYRTMGMELWKNVREFGTQLFKRKAWLATQWCKSADEIQRISTESYPLAAKFDKLWNSYPQLIAQLNDIKLASPGRLVGTTLLHTKSLLDQIITLKEATGKIGLALIPTALIAPLDSLKEQLNSLAGNIQATTQMSPLIDASQAPSTYWALYEIIKSFAWRGGMQMQIDAMQHINEITKQKKVIQTAITTFQKSLQSWLQDEISEEFHGL